MEPTDVTIEVFLNRLEGFINKRTKPAYCYFIQGNLVTEAEYAKARSLTVLDLGSLDIAKLSGQDYFDDRDNLRVIPAKLVEQVDEQIRAIKLVPGCRLNTNSGVFDILESDYRAMRPQPYYNLGRCLDFRVFLTSTALIVGCQNQSLDRWKTNYRRKIRDSIWGTETHPIYISAFKRALPQLEALQAQLINSSKKRK